MSRIIIQKDVCDRCGKELRLPKMEIMKGRRGKIIALATRKTWGDGYPIDRITELCSGCAKEFEQFMGGKQTDAKDQGRY